MLGTGSVHMIVLEGQWNGSSKGTGTFTGMLLITGNNSRLMEIPET